MQTVGTAIIPFGNRTAGQREERIALRNKGQARLLCARKSNGKAGCHSFRCTGFQSQGNLNVLYIILRQGENLVFHSGCLATTAEIFKLEAFVNSRSGLCQNRTLTGNKAPCIQLSATIQSNAAIILHINKAAGTAGTAGRFTCLTGFNLCRKADGTANGKLSTGCHGQLTKCSRLFIGCAIFAGSGSIQRIRIIKRNQQSNSGRNGIFTRKQSAIACKSNDLTAGSCLGAGRSQIIVQILIIYNEPRGSGSSTKHSLNRLFLGCLHCIAGRRRQTFIGCCINPTDKLCAGGGSCSQSRARGFNIILTACCDYIAINLHGTKATVIVKGDLISVRQNRSFKVTHGKGSCFITTLARSNIDFKAIAAIHRN